MGVALRLVSYNVHSLRDDLGALADVVRGLEPDIVVVQEAPRRWRWRTKCATLAHSFGLYYTVGGLPSLGNMIATSLRVTVLDAWCMRFPLTPGRHMRGAAFVRCSVPGSAPIVIAGTHLSTDDIERPAQAQLLKPCLSPGHDPIVLAADLNETPDGQSWRLLADGMVDAGRPGTATFPARLPDRRLDVILVDPRITVAARHTVRGALAVRASDHLPVVADLSLPPAAAPQP